VEVIKFVPWPSREEKLAWHWMTINFGWGFIVVREHRKHLSQAVDKALLRSALQKFAAKTMIYCFELKKS